MKMSITMACLLFILAKCHVHAQLDSPKSKPQAETHKIFIEYKGKKVKARQLRVSSQIQLPLDTAWEKVQTPALLQFVAKGRISFKAIEGDFPDKWGEGDTLAAKMKFYGFLPIGGVHYLFIERIDPVKKQIQTREWDNMAKVWDHKIELLELGEERILYEDEIIIYAGAFTGLVTAWARSFYKHRQKRWQLLGK